MLIKTDLEKLFKQETGFKKDLESEMYLEWIEEKILAFLNTDMTIAIRKSTNKNSK
jgi:hypothetical protein